MKKTSVLLALLACLSVRPACSFADSLNLVSVTGPSVGGEPIYPYNFSVDGSSTTTALMCIDFNRTISVGETWNVTIASMPLDGSQSSIDYRADAWIYSQLGTQTAADVQYAVWDILDPTDINNHPGFGATAQTLEQTGLLMAQNSSLISSGFFSQYALYAPTDDQTGWTYGIPQEFIGAAQTPEPSSLVLMGSGLIGVAGALRRKLVRA